MRVPVRVTSLAVISSLELLASSESISSESSLELLLEDDPVVHVEPKIKGRVSASEENLSKLSKPNEGSFLLVSLLSSEDRLEVEDLILNLVVMKVAGSVEFTANRRSIGNSCLLDGALDSQKCVLFELVKVPHAESSEEVITFSGNVGPVAHVVEGADVFSSFSLLHVEVALPNSIS